MKKKFLLISPKNRTAYNFRGDLIKDIIANGYDVIVTGPNRDSVEKIEALGAKFVEIPMNKNGINPVADLKYIWRLRKLLKSEQIDISLGYTIKPFLYGAMAARLAGVKNINSMVAGAGYLFANKSLKARLLRVATFALYKLGFACATHVIFQNVDDLNEFVDKGFVKKSKCHVVNGSGVNMAKFVPSEYPKVPTFFMLGRMIYSKGVMDFLEAARIVKNSATQTVRFMILGKIEKMQDGIKEEDIEPYVKDGIVEHFPETDNIAQYYAQTSVFVLPTAYREGTPRVILEAMASARPIITTFMPGCKETVIEGKNGFFVEIHNPQQLAQKMVYFIEHPEAIAHMGEESLKLCKTKYDVQVVNQDMLRIMEIS